MAGTSPSLHQGGSDHTNRQWTVVRLHMAMAIGPGPSALGQPPGSPVAPPAARRLRTWLEASSVPSVAPPPARDPQESQTCARRGRGCPCTARLPRPPQVVTPTGNQVSLRSPPRDLPLSLGGGGPLPSSETWWPPPSQEPHVLTAVPLGLLGPRVPACPCLGSAMGMPD